MDWVVVVYWVCLALGLGYTIVSFALGEIGGHGGDIGGHGGDFSHEYGVPGHGGHGEASGVPDSGGQVIFGPFSPLVIAFFLAVFGVSGLVLSTWFNITDWWMAMPAALVLSVLSAWGFIKLMNRLFGNLQVSSEVRLSSLVGMEAEVTVAIPPSGLGEIAYIAMGSRNVSPARSDEQTTIPRFATVRIVRITGNLFFVRPVVEEQLRGLEGSPVSSKHE